VPLQRFIEAAGLARTRRPGHYDHETGAICQVEIEISVVTPGNIQGQRRQLLRLLTSRDCQDWPDPQVERIPFADRPRSRQPNWPSGLDLSEPCLRGSSLPRLVAGLRGTERERGSSESAPSPADTTAVTPSHAQNPTGTPLSPCKQTYHRAR